MTHFVGVPHNDQLKIRNGGGVFTEGLPHTPEENVPVASEPLSRDRVVAEIIRAVRAMRGSFSERQLTGDTNLALDLGLESASRVELLLEVERALDVALDVGVVVMFAELTIAQLAELIVALPDASTDG
jgi:acyl carrier protein